MEFKQNFLDRVEQSFEFLMQNFLKITLPVMIFYVVVYYIFYWVSVYILWFVDVVTYISYTNYNVLLSLLALWIVYLFLEIWIIIWLYTTIDDIVSWKNLPTSQIYIESFKNIFQAFKTYYYVFMYVYFVPAILFIVSGLYLIYIMYAQWVQITSQDVIRFIPYLVWVSIAFFVYVMYRGNKASFWLVSAIVSKDFSYGSFKASLEITKNKWWRIFWNFFWAGMLIWLAGSVVNGIIWWWWGAFVQDLIKNKDSLNVEMVVNSILSELVSFGSIFSGVLSRVILSITVVFIFVFAYFFYKRLCFELQNNKLQSDEVV